MARFQGVVPAGGSAGLLDPHQVLHFIDHPANRRGVFQLAHAVELMQPKADQRLPLILLAADRAADLPHTQGFLAILHWRLPWPQLRHGFPRDGREYHRPSCRAWRRSVAATGNRRAQRRRSEEHTSELQSLMRISYAVFCLKKQKNNTTQTHITLK